MAALQIAKAAGARVLVTSRSAEKLGRAASLGADATIIAPPNAIAQEIMRLTEGRGVDVVIENIGGAIWNAALKVPRPRGPNSDMRRDHRRSAASRPAPRLYTAVTDLWIDPRQSRRTRGAARMVRARAPCPSNRRALPARQGSRSSLASGVGHAVRENRDRYLAVRCGGSAPSDRPPRTCAAVLFLLRALASYFTNFRNSGLRFS